MKKCLILFLLSLSVPLFAQISREAKIFLPPVSVTGSQEDASFFYKHLSNETVLRYYATVKNRRNSDFVLRGTVEPYSEIDISQAIEEKEILRALEIIENYNASIKNSKESIFSLELINNATGETVGKQHLVYGSTNDASIGELVSLMVYNLLSGIPDINELDDCRNRWLFVGVSGLWAPRVYIGEQQSVNWANFGVAVSAEYQFLNFLSVNLDVQFTRDWVVVSLTNKEEYTDLMLEIPLSLRFVFKPLDYFMLEPYSGVSLNLSLTGSTEPSLFSWFAGFQFGVKAGPGVIVIDPRFSLDFHKSVIPQRNIEYDRYLIQVAAGYKLGLLPKKPRAKPYER